MKLPRIFLSGFLVLSFLCVVGFAEAEDSHNRAMTKQKRVAKEKIYNDTKALKANRKKVTGEKKPIVAKSANARGKADIAEQNELHLPLDLSVPYTDVEKDDPLAEQNPDNETQKSTIFSNANKKKSRPVQLDGRLLMSPEPEAEKRKSADGAGIVINVKP